MPVYPLDSLLRPNATMDEVLFYSKFYSNFNPGGVAHNTILNMEPLIYIGAVAGTELLTYAATKLYLAFELCVNGSILQAAGVLPEFTLYNEANTKCNSKHRHPCQRSEHHHQCHHHEL